MNKDFLNVAAAALVLLAGYFGHSAYTAYHAPLAQTPPVSRFPQTEQVSPLELEAGIRTSDLFTAPADGKSALPMTRAWTSRGATTQPSMEQRLRPYLSIPQAPGVGSSDATPAAPRPWKRSATYAALALIGAFALSEKASAR